MAEEMRDGMSDSPRGAERARARDFRLSIIIKVLTRIT